MSRDLLLFISDIIESIDYILGYAKGISEQEFKTNKMVQDAVIRRLEIVGEAVKNIPEDVRKKYNQIPWKSMAGLRDVLIHAYFGVRVERIWNLIQNELLETQKLFYVIKDDIEAKEQET